MLCSANLMKTFSVNSVPSGRLLLPFIAPRAEFSGLLGGPGFRLAEVKFLSVGFSR
jgi:hypothetical protein